jgi:class 3 adenylate cyclase
MAGAQAIVFADVVSSTELFGRLGDGRAGAMIGSALELAKSAFEDAGGHVVKNLTAFYAGASSDPDLARAFLDNQSVFALPHEILARPA